MNHPRASVKVSMSLVSDLCLSTAKADAPGPSEDATPTATSHIVPGFPQTRSAKKQTYF